jgi:hypothetical protein
MWVRGIVVGIWVVGEGRNCSGYVGAGEWRWWDSGGIVAGYAVDGTEEVGTTF